MATTYTNPAYPHQAAITRPVVTDTYPKTASYPPIWSGPCDCQVGTGGRTQSRDSVFVSDYAIYTACIEVELKVGDRISIIRKEGHAPIECSIVQHATDHIFIQDGVSYGTTIWANEVKQ